MSRLTRDGTAEPVSRDQILRHARGQGNIIFPVQLTTSRIGNLTRLIHTLLYVMTIHTYILIVFLVFCFGVPTCLVINFSVQYDGLLPNVTLWEREANMNWSMVTCQGSTRSDLP